MILAAFAMTFQLFFKCYKISSRLLAIIYLVLSKKRGIEVITLSDFLKATFLAEVLFVFFISPLCESAIENLPICFAESSNLSLLFLFYSYHIRAL
jgi:hypothetical protein